MGRVLVIGVDAMEVSCADRLIEASLLPSLADHRTRAARVLLEHGPAQRTGLGWEHFWSGLDPDAAGRGTAVEFDPATYRVWQAGARFSPFFGDLARETVVFDTPYADLERAPDLRGVVAWGAHDPGIDGGPWSRPTELLDEFRARFGDYPATRWTYAVPWGSAELCREMGEELCAGIEARSAGARWLLGERFRDWELAMVVVSELHSGTEAMWHGVDPDHPLYHHPSAGAAADALHALYQRTDRMIGDLVDAVDASVVIVFGMGGMGPNTADVTSMLLLPELMYRWSTGNQLLTVPDAWATQPDGVPGLGDLDGWATRWQRDWYPSAPDTGPAGPNGPIGRDERRLRAPAWLPMGARRLVRKVVPAPTHPRPTGHMPLDWQPTTWYRPHWPEMKAFALPSFYDGRIRVNLRGREAQGIVNRDDYMTVCDEIEEMVRECTNPRTGESVVADVHRGAGTDPRALDSSESDLTVVWQGDTNALAHPRHGVVGPVPHRRTGGHTGPHGFAWITGPGFEPGDYGVASSFDVAPTILELFSRSATGLSGTSLLDRLNHSGVPAH